MWTQIQSKQVKFTVLTTPFHNIFFTQVQLDKEMAN